MANAQYQREVAGAWEKTSVEVREQCCKMMEAIISEELKMTEAEAEETEDESDTESEASQQPEDEKTAAGDLYLTEEGDELFSVQSMLVHDIMIFFCRLLALGF